MFLIEALDDHNNFILVFFVIFVIILIIVIIIILILGLGLVEWL